MLIWNKISYLFIYLLFKISFKYFYSNMFCRDIVVTK